MHVALLNRTLGALAALGMLALATATAASPEAPQSYTIGTAESHVEVPNWKLAISGTWATQCPPALENVVLDGNDLRVDSRSVLGLCARAATPFSIEVDPALALGHESLAAGIYHVSFYAADGAQARARLRAFSLLDHSAPGAASVTPEAGFWWTTGGADRNVLSIELQGPQISVALMSYDSAGQPQWHFGAAPYAGRTAHVPLLRLQGGSDPFANQATAPERGESTFVLDLQFHSGAHASAWLSRLEGTADDPTLRLREFDVVRLPVMETADGGAWQGTWVLVDDAGAQRLQFDRFAAVDADHFELADNAGKITLACTRDAKFPDLPPSSCALRKADGNNMSLFDSVAVSRMDGNTADGIPVHLLRVSADASR
jgi:hypothetical protein